MTKVLCSVCGSVGVLEVRGSSQRVTHYQYVNGKRIFSRHKIDGYSDTGTVGTNNSKLGLNNEIKPIMRLRTEREGDVLAARLPAHCEVVFVYVFQS
jgi:hypothetical protein